MQQRVLTLALAAAGLMTACGGGSSNSSSPPAVTPAAADITLAGVVSTSAGTPAASRSVVAKCATGTGNVTTNAEGSYRLTVSAAALPCLLEAVLADGTELHSVATGTGSTATANINPVTELVVANLAGGNTSSYFDAFTSSTASAVTSTSVTNSVAAVAPVLTSAGVNTGSLGNVLTAPVDSSYTAALGALDTSLTAAGTTLSDLSTSVATGSPQSTTSSATASLPADLLVKPKASNCAALRSGTYHWVQLMASSSTAPTAPVTSVADVVIDATALTVAAPGDPTTTLTASGACHYTANGGADEYFVSPAGVIVFRGPETVAGITSNYLSVAVPAQAHTVSELQGRWNTLGWEKSPNFSVSHGIITFDASGLATSAKCFDDPITTAESACTVFSPPLSQLSVNSGGGFNNTSTDPTDAWVDRAIAYRAGNGDLMLISIDSQGEFSFLTQPRARTLPSVGTVTANWTLGVNVNNIASVTPSTSTNTVTIVDSVAQSFTRTSVNTSAGGSPTTATQTLVINSPRSGYTHRLTGTGVREFYNLPLRGMGLNALYFPNTNTSGASNANFDLSVDQP